MDAACLTFRVFLHQQAQERCAMLVASFTRKWWVFSLLPKLPHPRPELHFVALRYSSQVKQNFHLRRIMLLFGVPQPFAADRR